MIFIPHFPRYPLSTTIEMFWYVVGQTPYQREKVLPTEHVELIFNLDAPHKVYTDGSKSAFDLKTDAWICGIQSKPIVTEATAVSHLVGVRFKPGGVYPY